MDEHNDLNNFFTDMIILTGAKDYQFNFFWIPSLGIMYHLGIDHSFPFILLTTILIHFILCS